MDFSDFIKELPTPQLKAIRQILTSGTEAIAGRRYADADGGKRLKQLTTENKRLKTLNERRDAVEACELEWDESYFMSLSDSQFTFVLNKMKDIKKDMAIAEKTHSIRVPNLIAEIDLDPVVIVREGFTNRRNGHNE